MLRLRHLRYTVAAAQHGSFRRAAERLRVQESAISRGVGEAEGIVGTRLFERSPKGVSLTAAGRMFVATSDDLLRQLSVLVSNLGRIEGRATGNCASAWPVRWSLADLHRFWMPASRIIRASVSNPMRRRRMS